MAVTLVLAITAPDGVAVAADSWITRSCPLPTGGFMRVPQPMAKVVPVTSGTMLAFAGSVPVVQDVVRDVRARHRDDDVGPHEIARTVSESALARRGAATENYKRIFGEERGQMFAPQVWFLVAGWRPGEGAALLRVGGDGKVLDGTAAGHMPLGAERAFLQPMMFCATLSTVLRSGADSARAAAILAYETLHHLAGCPTQRIQHPVRVWATGEGLRPEEMTDRLQGVRGFLTPTFEEAARKAAHGEPRATTMKR